MKFILFINSKLKSKRKAAGIILLSAFAFSYFCGTYILHPMLHAQSAAHSHSEGSDSDSDSHQPEHQHPNENLYTLSIPMVFSQNATGELVKSFNDAFSIPTIVNSVKLALESRGYETPSPNFLLLPAFFSSHINKAPPA